jgi:hypothetical protein
VLAVIAVTVVITVLVVGKDSGNSPSPTPTSTAGPSDIASANDKGPVTIIIEDPTCEPTRPIFDTRASVEHNGWDARDPSIPAAAWTPAMRSQYQAVAEAMRASADQMVPLVKLTPHRVMRELYEQVIVYSRAYADNIPTYTPQDDKLAIVSTTVSNAIGYICAAISYGSAAARGPLVQPLGRLRRSHQWAILPIPSGLLPNQTRSAPTGSRRRQSSATTRPTGFPPILTFRSANGPQSNEPSMTPWHP